MEQQPDLQPFGVLASLVIKLFFFPLSWPIASSKYTKGKHLWHTQHWLEFASHLKPSITSHFLSLNNVTDVFHPQPIHVVFVPQFDQMNVGRVCQDKGRWRDGLACQLVMSAQDISMWWAGFRACWDFKCGCLCAASRKIRATWILWTGLCLT